MKKTRLAFTLAAMLAPALAQAAPPPGGPNGTMPPPPPPAECSYSDHTCQVTSPEVSFVVSKVNGVTPSSSNDCKLLPPCGHRPPPPPPGGNPPPPMGDNPPPKP